MGAQDDRVRPARHREGQGEDPQGWRRDHHLRPARSQSSHWSKHSHASRTSQAACCPETVRRRWSAQLSREASHQVQGTQVRVRSWTSRVQRIQEIDWKYYFVREYVFLSLFLR